MDIKTDFNTSPASTPCVSRAAILPFLPPSVRPRPSSTARRHPQPPLSVAIPKPSSAASATTAVSASLKSPKPFADAFALCPLPASEVGHRLYFSAVPAWVPESTVPASYATAFGVPRHMAVFGGCVYAQAILAAERALEEDAAVQSVKTHEVKTAKAQEAKTPQIHTVQGTFFKVGRCDRPFIYAVSTPPSPASTCKTLQTRLVTVRQPISPSGSVTIKSGAPAVGEFSFADTAAALDDVCFSALVTFRMHTPTQKLAPSPRALPPPPAPSPTSMMQDVFPAEYAPILASRRRCAWPTVSVHGLPASVFAVSSAGASAPALETRRVDMRAYNSGRPGAHRRELLLYRLRAPMGTRSAAGYAAVHAFAADRNGLVAQAEEPEKVASAAAATAGAVSAAFYVHCRPEELVMKHSRAEDDDVWWMLEAMVPQSGSGGRSGEDGPQFTRVWSPRGVHVATGYQDGVGVGRGQLLRRRGSKL